MKSRIVKKLASGVMSLVLGTTALAGVVTVQNQEKTYFSAIVQTLEASAASYSTGTYMVNCPSGVNVRSSASTSGSKLGASSNGTTFVVSQISGSWGYTTIKCTNGTQKGWVCLNNCKFIGGSSNNSTSSANYQVIITATSGLNVRSSYSASSSKVTAIPYNTKVTVTEVSSNNWGKVNYNGKTGWISLSYTKKVTTPTSIYSCPSSISTNGINFIKKYEGFSKYKYWDNSQYSIGYGSKCNKNDYPNGITETQATNLLKTQLKTYETAVQNMCKKNNISLNQNQYDALVSFTYNVGTGWTTSSSLKTYLASGGKDASKIKSLLGAWVYSGGQKNQGLVNRRNAEATLFNS